MSNDSLSIIDDFDNLHIYDNLDIEPYPDIYNLDAVENWLKKFYMKTNIGVIVSYWLNTNLEFDPLQVNYYRTLIQLLNNYDNNLSFYDINSYEMLLWFKKIPSGYYRLWTINEYLNSINKFDYQEMDFEWYIQQGLFTVESLFDRSKSLDILNFLCEKGDLPSVKLLLELHSNKLEIVLLDTVLSNNFDFTGFKDILLYKIPLKTFFSDIVEIFIENMDVLDIFNNAEIIKLVSLLKKPRPLKLILNELELSKNEEILEDLTINMKRNFWKFLSCVKEMKCNQILLDFYNKYNVDSYYPVFNKLPFISSRVGNETLEKYNDYRNFTISVEVEEFIKFMLSNGYECNYNFLKTILNQLLDDKKIIGENANKPYQEYDLLLLEEFKTYYNSVFEDLTNNIRDFNRDIENNTRYYRYHIISGVYNLGSFFKVMSLKIFNYKLAEFLEIKQLIPKDILNTIRYAKYNSLCISHFQETMTLN